MCVQVCMQGFTWEAEFVSYRVSVIIGTCNLAYWVWHVSAASCFGSVKSSADSD